MPGAPATAKTNAPWRCPNCQLDVASPFCGQCGERPIVGDDLTLRGALARLFHAPPASMAASPGPSRACFAGPAR